MGAAVSATISPVLVASEAIALDLAKLVDESPVPRNGSAQQLRRSIGCGKAKPFHMQLLIGFDYADNLEIPIGVVTEPYEQLVEFLRERRRIRLEAQSGGATHAIEGPSLLREIKRENRAEYLDANAEDEVLDNEEDPAAIERMLAASAVKRHELDRRDARARQKLARLRLKRAG